jgi:hypothetical protein
VDGLWGAWSALGPIVADRELGGAPDWGLVLAVMGVGALLGSLSAIRAAPRRLPSVPAAMPGASAGSGTSGARYSGSQ